MGLERRALVALTDNLGLVVAPPLLGKLIPCFDLFSHQEQTHGAQTYMQAKHTTHKINLMF